MKKQILSFLFVLGLGLFMTNTAFADNEPSVSTGFSTTYKVTNNSTNGKWTGGTPTYLWALTGANGTDWSANGGSGLDNTIDQVILWKKAGTYTFTVTATDVYGCLTEPITMSVTVTDAQICIDNRTSGGNPPANTTLCSLIANSTSPSNPGTVDGGTGDNIVFHVLITGGVANGNYTVNYTVTKGASTYNGSEDVTVDGSGNTDHEITVSYVGGSSPLPAIFTNDSGADETIVTSLTSLKIGAETIDIKCDSSTGITTFNSILHTTPIISF
ncbi:MAG: hypothetical protein K0M50_07425 [Prolixibacteraceae bacterium]|nr:hypothetical protein [Prolixibacteraceae bacterium]